MKTQILNIAAQSFSKDLNGLHTFNAQGSFSRLPPVGHRAQTSVWPVLSRLP